MKILAEAYRGRTGETCTEMIGFSQCDAEMREAFFVGYLKPRREAAKAALQRGIDQGEFLPNLDLEALVDALCGPLIYRMLTGYYPIDNNFINQIRRAVVERINPTGKKKKKKSVSLPPPPPPSGGGGR